MRIAIDARMLANKPFGGVGVYTRNLVEKLSAIDHQNEYQLLFTGLKFDPGHLTVSLGANFRPVKLPIMDREIPLRNLALSHLVWPAALAYLRSDVLLLPTPDGELPRLTTAKSVITVHDLRGLYALPGDLPQDIPAIRRSCRRADLVLTVSEFTKGDIIKHFDIPSRRVVVARPGYNRSFKRLRDGDSIAALRGRYGLDRPFFLFVGGLIARKNVERLVEAFAGLPRREKYLLVHAGDASQGDRLPRLQQLINEHSLSDDLRFLGPVSEDDLVLLYNAALALAFPSLVEGFGIPVLEAMACGTPVITSNVTALPEVASGAARLVDPLSVESIRAGMLDVATNNQKRVDMIARGFANVKRFSWERMAETILDALERVVAARG